MTHAFLLFCDETSYCLMSDEVDQLISSMSNSDQITSDDYLYKLTKITPLFQLFVLYTEENLDSWFQFTDQFVICYSIDQYSSEFSKFDQIVSILRAEAVMFSSTDTFIAEINRRPMTNLNNLFIELIVRFIQESDDEIKILYRIKSKIINYLVDMNQSFRDLVYETMKYSEIIAAKCLGALKGDDTRTIADYIENVEFLLDFLAESSHSTRDRFAVVSSIVYRQLIPVSKCLELLHENIGMVMTNPMYLKSEFKELALFSLKGQVILSLAKFHTYTFQLMWELSISYQDVIDVLLEAGKAVDYLEFLETMDKSDQEEELQKQLEIILAPEEKSVDNQKEHAFF